MSDTAKPMLGATFYIELDTEDQSHGSSILQPSRETSNERSRALKPFKNAFKDAWHDLRAARHRPNILEWRRLIPSYSITVWSPSLLTLTILLALSLPMRLDENGLCQSNGNFHVPLSRKGHFEGAFNYWAASGFFDVTLAWGRLDFSTVKLIDVAWDLIVGRGGQAIMALVSWRVFAEYLQVSLATTPARYTTVWLLRFQQSSSAFSTWQLACAFYKRRLASKTAMVFTILSAIFTMAFPTLIASMTGYTPKNEPYIVADNGRLNPLTDLVPAAYVIHDGDRVKGFTKEYVVPWKGGSSRQSNSDLFDYCHDQQQDYEDDDCQLQRNVSEYIQKYGFKIFNSEVSGQWKYLEIQNKTKFSGQDIDWPPLSISAFYLPDSTFYWNWTLDNVWYNEPVDGGLKPIRNVSNSVYLMDDRLYSLTELNKKGTCQPIKEDENVQKYQWGFSFLQLFSMTILLQIWTLGLVVMWTNAHRTLRLNDSAAPKRGWKTLLEFAAAIDLELKSAGINPEVTRDEDLEHKIEQLLQGGSIMSPQLTEKSSSTWRWIWKHKWHFLALLLSVSFIIMDNVFYFFPDDVLEHTGPDIYPAKTFPEDLMIIFYGFPFLACIASSFIIRATYAKRLVVFLVLLGLCVPLSFYSTFQRDLVLPGALLCWSPALVLGSTRGSRVVLFTVPFACNYIAVFVWFVCGIKSQKGPHYD